MDQLLGEGINKEEVAVDIMEVDDNVVEDQKWKNSRVSCEKVLN